MIGLGKRQNLETGGRNRNLRRNRLIHLKRINDKFSDCECVSQGFTSEQLLAKIKYHVSSTVDDFVQECTPEMYFHRIIFMSMMKDLKENDKLDKHDDLYIQTAQELSDNTARSWPGYWIFVYLEIRPKTERISRSTCFAYASST